jgi:hypothetical protein
MRQKKKKQNSRYKRDTTKKKTKIQLKKNEDKIVWGSDIYKKSDCLCILYGYAEQDKKI